MTEQRDDDQQQLAEDQRRHRKLTDDLVRIDAEQRKHERRIELLGAELDREGRDVRRLQGLSPAALLASLLGDRQQRLQQELQQLAAAKLRYDSELQTLQALVHEEVRCRGELAALGDLEQRRQQLLAAREADLRAGAAPAAERLADLAVLLGEVRADQRETGEAIDAGRQALAALDEAAQLLGSARGWGTFDLLGGGLIATSVKHSRIDAAGAAARAQQHLQRFARELQDVGQKCDGLAIEVGGFARFADYFFDGLVADWLVQSKIGRGLEAVRGTAADVREAVLRLERRHGELQQQLQRLQQQREQLLLAGG